MKEKELGYDQSSNYFFGFVNTWVYAFSPWLFDQI
jgi:hypothetical protein